MTDEKHEVIPPDYDLDATVKRLRVELHTAQTLLAEAEALIGERLVPALRRATERVGRRRPYALTDLVAQLEEAFGRMASERNEWRARARRQERS